ncbi:cytochrome c oxidase assembly factor 5-like [Tubulanus polymorphus]|uniref:cytochrome c oxidase assembly factor 5-like n=1 Tax=Tubulanus polymorphus TaxID=672921 RepID=UPI003DA34A78
MPKYFDEDDTQKSKFACSGLREDLLECLLKSNCVRKDKKTPLACLKLSQDAVSYPSECHKLRVAFFECKRSLLDMRQRFRGPKGY